MYKIRLGFLKDKYGNHPKLPISSSVLDRLGFSEYWDEHCVWGTRTLSFQNNTSLTIIEHLEQDDVYEGYGRIRVYGANYYLYSSSMENRKGEEISRELYFIEDLYDVIKYICPENIPEFVELCKKANMGSYIDEYLNNGCFKVTSSFAIEEDTENFKNIIKSVKKDREEKNDFLE